VPGDGKAPGRPATFAAAGDAGMLARYVAAMDALHRLCMFVAGVCLVVITIIIPWGVFTRYVLNYGSSWPEPLAVLLMIWFSFTAAALCYRERLHISVQILPALLQGRPGLLIGWAVELAMAGMNLFMLVWGVRLVHTTWFQVIADFPLVSVGLSYLPVPIGGAITLLFVIERLWTGRLYEEPVADEWAPVAVE
jgi:TRAP-type C4-dicarboxylate transport system permease small subunit